MTISPPAGRAGSLVLSCVTLLLLWPASASAECGQTTSVSPHRTLVPGPPPLAIGDSVLYDAADVLANYGFASNAMVCRTMDQGIVWLREHARGLPGLIVVALGTNGAVSAGQIDELLRIIGPVRALAMVTPHHGDYAYVPGLIRAAAQQHSGQILVLDWDRLSARHPGWFAPDGIHLGGTAGIDGFARLLASSLLATPVGAPASKRPAAPSTVTQPPAPPPVKQSHVSRAAKRRAPPPGSTQRSNPPTTNARPAQPRATGSVEGLAWQVVSAVEALSLALVGA